MRKRNTITKEELMKLLNEELDRYPVVEKKPYEHYTTQDNMDVAAQYAINRIIDKVDELLANKK